MDVCTIVMATTLLNTMVCTPEPSNCATTMDGERKLCMSAMTCPMPVVEYDCKEPDGTTYRWAPDPAKTGALLSPAAEPR